MVVVVGDGAVAVVVAGCCGCGGCNLIVVACLWLLVFLLLWWL